jgi:DNA-binding NarL/FixJ family response regulator
VTTALSPRQHQVLAHLANGFRAKEIARELRIDYGTTKLHIEAAMRKLGARSSTQAVATAIRSNLI